MAILQSYVNPHAHPRWYAHPSVVIVHPQLIRHSYGRPLGVCSLPARMRVRSTHYKNAGTEEDRLRQRYAREFSESPTLLAWADLPRPPKRTKRSAIESGNRVLTQQSTRHNEAYTDIDCYTQSLWYHNKILHTLYDLAHQFTNIIKHTFNWMKNTTTKNSVKFTPAVRGFETMTMSRFPGLKAISVRVPGSNKPKFQYPKPPWVATNAKEVDRLPSLCRVPLGWAAYRSMFKDLGFAKSSETLLFAGDVGGYTLRHVEMDADYRAMFLELFRIVETYVTRIYTHIHLYLAGGWNIRLKDKQTIDG
jgi:hypothetical protein